MRVNLFATAVAANTDAMWHLGDVASDEEPGRSLRGLSQEEVELARRDDPDQLAELLVSYDW